MASVLLIQRLPTLHNNHLINALRNRSLDVYEAYEKETFVDLYGGQSFLSPEFKGGFFGSHGGWSKLVRLVFFSGFDHVVITGWGGIHMKFAIFLLILRAKKFFFWADCPIDQKTFFFKYLRRLVYLLLVKARVHFLIPDKRAKNWFLDLGISEARLSVFPVSVKIGVTDDFLRTTHRFVYPLRIFGGSRLIYDKGFDLVIDAIARLDPSERKNFFLEIAGDGPERRNLELQAKEAGIDDRVRFIGWLDSETFLARVRQSDVFISPARWDAFGNIVYGLAAGSIVVGSYGSGAVRDLISHGVNGFVFNPSNEDELTSIFKLISRDWQNLADIRVRAANSLNDSNSDKCAEMLELLFQGCA